MAAACTPFLAHQIMAWWFLNSNIKAQICWFFSCTVVRVIHTRHSKISSGKKLRRCCCLPNSHPVPKKKLSIWTGIAVGPHTRERIGLVRHTGLENLNGPLAESPTRESSWVSSARLEVEPRVGRNSGGGLTLLRLTNNPVSWFFPIKLSGWNGYIFSLCSNSFFLNILSFFLSTTSISLISSRVYFFYPPMFSRSLSFFIHRYFFPSCLIIQPQRKETPHQSSNGDTLHHISPIQGLVWFMVYFFFIISLYNLIISQTVLRFCIGFFALESHDLCNGICIGFCALIDFSKSIST